MVSSASSKFGGGMRSSAYQSPATGLEDGKGFGGLEVLGAAVLQYPCHPLMMGKSQVILDGDLVANLCQLSVPLDKGSLWQQDYHTE